MKLTTALNRFTKLRLPYATLANRTRQTLLLGGIGIFLSACSTVNEEDLGKVGFVEGFLGGVVADEPNAALIGRDVLSAGGTAADAVTAMYFAASVTMPSSASLAGGGVCVYHDNQTATTEAIDFLTRAPATLPPGVERPTAIPMNTRGFFMLQSKYGDLRWAQLISPAENLARFGTQVSRALATEIRPVGTALIRDGEARRVFARPDGTPVREGDIIKQLDLAATLTEIRTKGPAAFFTGQYANRFVEAVNEAGGYLNTEDLRNAIPLWRETIKAQPYDFKTAHFAPPAAGGVVGAQIWSMLAEQNDFKRATEAEKAHLLADHALRSFADRSRWVKADGTAGEAVEGLVDEDYIERLLAGFQEGQRPSVRDLSATPKPTPEVPAALSLAAVDRFGSGVACNVSMNNAFGIGRIAPGTGVLLAAKPGLNGRGPMPLGPMVMVNPNSNLVYFAGAASQGVSAPTSLVNLAARTIMAEEDGIEAQKKARVHHGGHPDQVFYEDNITQDVLQGLSQRGYQTKQVSRFGIVNAIACKGGIPVEPETCQLLVDPRGFGLGLGSN